MSLGNRLGALSWLGLPLGFVVLLFEYRGVRRNFVCVWEKKATEKPRNVGLFGVLPYLGVKWQVRFRVL